ncbi:MAG: hypothetical protein M3285_05645 [Actinomycetota bacterium]|nr:hypothetical protein [Actinomycetota bacterium]
MDQVVRRGGWGFTLPEGHRLEVDDDAGTLTLTAADGQTATYRLISAVVSDDETTYEIDADSTNGDGYPFPSIGEEIDRLRRRWEAAGGDLTAFTGWAQGSGYDDHLRDLRKRLRSLEAPHAATG